MPTYDYRCTACGTFEFWQSIHDAPLSACPQCGSRVERLLSANVGFVLKGAGFYQNEYKNRPAEASRAGKASGTDGDKSSGAAPEGCGTCGSPDPCPSGNN